MAKNYLSYAEATKAVRAAGITSVQEFIAWRSSVQGMPSAPARIYKGSFINWPEFLTGVDTVTKINLASAIAFNKQHGVKNLRSYLEKCKTNPSLPKCPDEYYASGWSGWRNFFGKPEKSLIFDYESAKAEANKLGIKTAAAYRNMCDVEGRFPLVPERHYAENWKGWLEFLGKEKAQEKYSYEEAAIAARQLGIKNSYEYMHLKMYKSDKRLPSTPYSAYKEQWKSWSIFLGLENA